MTIRILSGEEHRRLGQTISYRDVELQETEPFLYDEDPTPFQRQIEMSVTNGRGYLSIQNALDIVNRESPQLNLYDTLDTGLIPLYFKERDPPTDIKFTNPCGEIPLGEQTPVVLPPFAFRPPTLLESLKTRQNMLWRENVRRDNPYVLFSAA